MKSKGPLMTLLIIMTIVILVVIIFFIAIHYLELTRVKDSLEIAQLPTYDPEKLLLARKDNTPVIIKEFLSIPSLDYQLLKDKTDLLEAFKITNQTVHKEKLNIKQILELYGQDKGGFVDCRQPDLLNEQEREKLLAFRSPLCQRLDLLFSLLPTNYQSPLTRYFTNLNLYLIKEGHLSFKLYHPKYHKHLAYQSNSSRQLEIWETKPTLSDQAQYIEVIVRTGQGILIPPTWIYSFTCQGPTSMVHLTTTNLAANLFAIRERIWRAIKS